jgi:hypothetical protein
MKRRWISGITSWEQFADHPTHNCRRWQIISSHWPAVEKQITCHGDQTPTPVRYKILSRPCREWPEYRQVSQRPGRLFTRGCWRCVFYIQDASPEQVIPKISQETLAEMIGTTRSRVSFFMNKFRRLGFIEYNGGIEVHSSLLNVVLHDQPPIKI